MVTLNISPTGSGSVDTRSAVMGERSADSSGVKKLNSPTNEKLIGIQQLRAIAAILVVLVHASSELTQAAHGIISNRIPHDLVIGVDIFFVISGFIMHVTSADSQSGAASALSFLRKRIVRIVPVYWFFTTLMLGTTILLSGKMSNPGLSAWHTLASYFFIPATHPSVDTLQPLLRVGWTLNYEMFFYAIFSASLFMPRKARLSILCSTLALLTLYGVLTESHGFARFYSSSVVLSFGFGLVIGAIWKAGRIRHGMRFVATYAALSFASYTLMHLFRSDGSLGLRGLTLGVPAAFVVLMTLSLPERDTSSGSIGGILARLGDSSYTLYLSHMFVIGAFVLVLSPSSPAQFILCTIACTAACVVAGHFAYLVIEKPLVHLAKLVFPDAKSRVPRRLPEGSN